MACTLMLISSALFATTIHTKIKKNTYLLAHLTQFSIMKTFRPQELYKIHTGYLENSTKNNASLVSASMALKLNKYDARQNSYQYSLTLDPAIEIIKQQNRQENLSKIISAKVYFADSGKNQLELSGKFVNLKDYIKFIKQGGNFPDDFTLVISTANQLVIFANRDIPITIEI